MIYHVFCNIQQIEPTASSETSPELEQETKPEVSGGLITGAAVTDLGSGGAGDYLFYILLVIGIFAITAVIVYLIRNKIK